MDLYLMSPPGPDWALRGRKNFRSRAAPDVDPARALAEWLALADALLERGARIAVLLPEDPALTGLPYAAESGHVVESEGRRLFLLPSMAAEHRRGERLHWRRVAERLGFVPVDVEGIWEAQGDVASFRGTTLLFFGGRTTREGAESAARHIPGEMLWIEVREPAFHGNMALLPLEEIGRILVCPDVLVGSSMDRLAERFGRETLLPVTLDELGRYATNGLPVGRDLLAPHLLPERVARLLTELGMVVHLLPMGELCEKAGGASRCLVCHVRVEGPGPEIPPDLDYRELAPSLRARCHA